MKLTLKNTNFIKINYYFDKRYEIVVSNKFPFGNNILNVLLATKIIKKLDLYVYSFQKWVYIKDILIKLNVCILW